MASVIVLFAIALFFGGIAVFVAIAIAVRREDRAYMLFNDAPDRLSRFGRRLNGVGRRDLDPEFLPPVGELVR
jgi:hypothetical protein